MQYLFFYVSTHTYSYKIDFNCDYTDTINTSVRFIGKPCNIATLQLCKILLMI
uniref:Uncharacterized protein n=1 Tax=viral metagenome TaxID=1070528 RepID=A0A6C0HMU8_9ZZZZ